MRRMLASCTPEVFALPHSPQGKKQLVGDADVTTQILIGDIQFSGTGEKDRHYHQTHLFFLRKKKKISDVLSGHC